MKCKWIVVTGMDGSGKTTLKKNLVNHFTTLGNSVKDFKLPFDKHLLSLLDVSGGGKPFVDNYTDRLIFVLDNRIASYHISKWKEEFDLLISQRGFLDSFVFGSIQGFSYKQICDLNRIDDLEYCDAMIHLNAAPAVAFNRIKDDPKGDKFETLEHLVTQYVETKRAYYEVCSGSNRFLKSFNNTTNFYIDTTSLTCDETFKIVLSKLENFLI